MAYHTYGFVDGAYVRALARDAHTPLASPYALVDAYIQSSWVRGLVCSPTCRAQRREWLV